MSALDISARAGRTAFITFIEKWKDKKVFDEHCATPYITHYFNDVRPQLVETFEVKIYEEILP